MAKELGVKMLNVYLDLIDEETKELCEQTNEEDKNTLEATKIALATKHNVADKFRRLITLQVMIKEAEEEISSIKEIISKKFYKHISENSYVYSWDRGLEDLAKKTMVNKTNILNAKIQDVKKQLKLAGCAEDVKNIFANLKLLLS